MHALLSHLCQAMVDNRSSMLYQGRVTASLMPDQSLRLEIVSIEACLLMWRTLSLTILSQERQSQSHPVEHAAAPVVPALVGIPQSSSRERPLTPRCNLMPSRWM